MADDREGVQRERARLVAIENAVGQAKVALIRARVATEDRAFRPAVRELTAKAEALGLELQRQIERLNTD